MHNISFEQKPKNEKVRKKAKVATQLYKTYIIYQVYFTVTIDGKEVQSVENANPKTFTNVKVFAGDKFKPAADASYRNLFWENFYVDHSFDIGTKIRGNKKIGIIETWGPFFRIRFDLIIHSLDISYTDGVAVVLKIRNAVFFTL